MKLTAGLEGYVWNSLDPQSHGHLFDDKSMYDLGEYVPLRERVIDSWLFEQGTGNLVGIGTSDVGTFDDPRYFSALSADKLVEQKENIAIRQAGNSVRLAGLRTWKKCDTQKTVVQVMPIYYSVDENICKNYLTPLTENMLEEIPSYG